MVYRRLFDRLLPQPCLVCGAPGQDGLALCRRCRTALPRNHPCCSRCALPLPQGSPPDALCGRCSRRPPLFACLQAPWRYQAPLDHLIQALKFSARLPAGRLLGQLLGQALTPTEPPQLLLPVPRHPKALRHAGFNHAAELTRALARELKLPWDPRLLAKVRITQRQATLDARARRRNLRGAFACTAPVGCRHVAVVDDVATTTATAQEITRTLLQAGVERVEVWTVCRTP